MTITKRNKIENETLLLKQVCLKYNVGCHNFNAGSFRLSKQGKVIDYYPKSQKCFRHIEQVWEVVSNITNFVKFEYQ